MSTLLRTQTPRQGPRPRRPVRLHDVRTRSPDAEFPRHRRRGGHAGSGHRAPGDRTGTPAHASPTGSPQCAHARAPGPCRRKPVRSQPLNPSQSQKLRASTLCLTSPSPVRLQSGLRPLLPRAALQPRRPPPPCRAMSPSRDDAPSAGGGLPSTALSQPRPGVPAPTHGRGTRPGSGGSRRGVGGGAPAGTMRRSEEAARRAGALGAGVLPGRSRIPRLVSRLPRRSTWLEFRARGTRLRGRNACSLGR